MLNIFLAALFAAFVSVGIMEATKGIFLKMPKVAKAIVSILIAAIVGVGVALVDVLLGNFSQLGKVILCVSVAIGSIGLSQVGYKFIAKPLEIIKEKFKSLK